MRVAVPVLAGLLLAFAACSAASNDPYFGHLPQPDPTHLTLCASGEPASLDPAFATATNDLKVVYELFDGLTTFDKEGLPLPSLATSWDVAPDRRRYTFHLRTDAKWSNGRSLVAADFLYSFARILHPATAAMNPDPLRALRHGKAYGNGTAEMVLGDAGPFKTGEAVALVETNNAYPGPNLRVARAATPLRLEPRPDAEVIHTAAAGTELSVFERRCDGGACWAYLLAPAMQGWARLDALSAPNDDRVYRVKGLDRDAEADLHGRDLLMLPELLGARSPDPHTLVVETENPVQSLPDLALQRAFRPVPREAIARWGRSWTEPAHIVTSGPFGLAGHQINDKIELVRSPTFWDVARVRLARVTFLSIESQAASANIYYQGGCDATTANSLPMSYLPAVTGKRDFRLAPFLGTYYLMVNMKRFPDVHFRRALALALDRSALTSLLRGWGVPSAHFVPARSVAELTPEERARCGAGPDDTGDALLVAPDLCYRPAAGLGYDPDAARRELALAREALGDQMPTKIVYRMNSGVEMHKIIGEWVQEEWRKVLGIDVELETQEWKTYIHDCEAGLFDVARMGWLGSTSDPNTDYLNVFWCGHPQNDMKFCDPEVDQKLDEIAAEPDGKRRMTLGHELETRVLSEAPIIPLFLYTQNHLQKPYVRDLYVNLADHQSLRATWIDPAWRNR